MQKWEALLSGNWSFHRYGNFTGFHFNRVRVFTTPQPFMSHIAPNGEKINYDDDLQEHNGSTFATTSFCFVVGFAVQQNLYSFTLAATLCWSTLYTYNPSFLSTSNSVQKSPVIMVIHFDRMNAPSSSSSSTKLQQNKQRSHQQRWWSLGGEKLLLESFSIQRKFVHQPE